ncbi:MAG: hypothetical protein KY396_07135 [Actinobacteria bacterium]|nr:hypothetical protein [Actinomycetota bacterium]
MRAGRRTTRRERRSTGRSLLIAATVLAFGVFLFWMGVALGRALDGAPEPGRTQTRVRTLEPATLEPVTRTVTVTTATG